MYRTQLILFLSLFIGQYTLNAQNLFGKLWSINYHDFEHNEIASFSMFLKQQGNTITGGHVAILDYGNILDYRGQSIKGIAKDSVAIITITTGRIANEYLATGTAILKILKGDLIRFTLLEAPKGQHLFPNKIVLPLHKGKK